MRWDGAVGRCGGTVRWDGAVMMARCDCRFVAVLDTQVTVGLEPPRVLLGCQHMCTMLESLLPAVRSVHLRQMAANGDIKF